MRISQRLLYAALAVTCFAAPTLAQIARTREPNGEPPRVSTATAWRADFPFAGLWRGTRILPPGTDTVTLLFTVDNGRYAGAMVYPRGLVVPHDKLTTTKDELIWEQRNSGGGMWVYTVRLAGRDRMEGTVTLRDAPTNLQPAPNGKIALVRQLPAGVK
jgi:hypothetical protein